MFIPQKVCYSFSKLVKISFLIMLVLSFKRPRMWNTIFETEEVPKISRSIVNTHIQLVCKESIHDGD